MKPLNLLMIGDKEASCREAVNLFIENGYQAHWIVKRGGSVCISDKDGVDICFLDLTSSGSAAYEIARKIRATSPTVCILMAIDASVTGARLNAFTAGADILIYSPYHSAELLACIDRLSRWVKC